MSRVRILTIFAIGSLLSYSRMAIAREGTASEEDQKAGMAREYRMKAQETLRMQLEAAEAQDAAWQNLSPAEQEKVLQSSSEEATQESNAIIMAALEAEASAPPPETCSSRGILEQTLAPDLFHDWEFIVSNYWGGIRGDTCEGVFAGYDPRNPLQGQLAVYRDLNNSSHYKLYPTPTATGPIHIVSEVNGLLTISSQQGAFARNTEFDNPGFDNSTDMVNAPGGAIYVFDLHTLRYRL
jgi:hypothetical protein